MEGEETNAKAQRRKDAKAQGKPKRRGIRGWEEIRGWKTGFIPLISSYLHNPFLRFEPSGEARPPSLKPRRASP
jgi:hypothetical protein